VRPIAAFLFGVLIAILLAFLVSVPAKSDSSNTLVMDFRFCGESFYLVTVHEGKMLAIETMAYKTNPSIKEQINKIIKEASSHGKILIIHSERYHNMFCA